MLGCPKYVLERRLCIYLGPSEFSAASGKICAVLVQMTLKYIQLHGVADSKLQRCQAIDLNGCGSDPEQHEMHNKP